MEKKIYISGKIGEAVISDATRHKFEKARQMLMAEGYEGFNPTDSEWQEHLKKRFVIDVSEEDRRGRFHFYSYILLRDLMSLATKDAIYMLPDWLDSPGAKAEHAFAVATGKKIIYDEELYANGTMRR